MAGEEDPDRAADLAGRTAAMRAGQEARVAQFDEVRERLAEARQRGDAARQARQPLHEEATARLTVRLEAMPVVEQAKGVLVVLQRCTPQEALVLLRGLARRRGVPLEDLARDVVRRAAAGLPPDLA